MNEEEKVLFESLHNSANNTKVWVYKVTNKCEANHLTTHNWSNAYDMYLERLDKDDYPTIELIEVENDRE